MSIFGNVSAEGQTKRPSIFVWLIGAVVVIGLVVAVMSLGSPGTGTVAGVDLEGLGRAAGFTPEQVEAALQTFVPPGEHDDYLLFSSGGHGGQAFVFGMPSMRLLRTIGVFTPEPWQGYGYTEATRKVLAEGNPEGQSLNWGDTHHPVLSTTDSEYDGEWLFLNDKVHARVAVISLKDFQTKQIVKNPLIHSNHGLHVTPNTEYVVEGAQFAVPFPPSDMALTEENYEKHFRGAVTFWSFNRDEGRIDTEESFSIELPPYWQDLVNVGNGDSDGLVYINSINTELAIGGVLDGNPPFEASVSANDMDYMHVIDWHLARDLIDQGKYDMVGGQRVLSLETAAAEGVLHFVPEPKSPHGVDTSPDGRWVVISGKLDPNVTVFDARKIRQAIEQKDYDSFDIYGVPVLSFDDMLAAQVNVGLGPLHTQFDDKGYAYTSLFIESAVAKWSLGEPTHSGDDAWQLMEKLPIQYNIGHLAAVGGDTSKPESKYLVALNKWSLDQYPNVGPLLPQNFQLIDISGDEMKLLSATPIGMGEPHYAQIIPMDRMDPIQVYPPGTDSHTMEPSPYSVKQGEERVERDADGTVNVYMTAMRSQLTPDHITVNKGDRVRIHITSIEEGVDVIHGFGIARHDVHASIEPGTTVTLEFEANRAGVFPYYCTEFCSALHLEMAGYLMVMDGDSR